MSSGLPLTYSETSAKLLDLTFFPPSGEIWPLTIQTITHSKKPHKKTTKKPHQNLQGKIKKKFLFQTLGLTSLLEELISNQQ